MKIYESAENYFETIHILKERIGMVRAIDIVNELGFSKPTVSIAMKKFKENGYINIDQEGHITLTSLGQEIADKTYEKHNIIATLLMSLGVPEKTAYEDSCRIEHHISDESFDCIKSYWQNHKL